MGKLDPIKIVILTGWMVVGTPLNIQSRSAIVVCSYVMVASSTLLLMAMGRCISYHILHDS